MIWLQGLLIKGNGLCHGIAGNGYMLHCLYRMWKQLSYHINISKHFFSKHCRSKIGLKKVYKALNAAKKVQVLNQGNQGILPELPLQKVEITNFKAF